MDTDGTIYFLIYSVIQSDENSFCGVVQDSFKKASWYENNNLVQINKSKYVRIIFYGGYTFFYKIIRKCILT